MKYSEIFHSIQGEGNLTGVPSVFFRTSYCNLRCSWCDTWYTSHEPENKDISVEEAFKVISDFECKHVVITGGEPFIQKEELKQLCQELGLAGHHITIETNGTVFVPVRANLISCSPKLRNSAPLADQTSRRLYNAHEKLRLNWEVLKMFNQHYNAQFKFVVTSTADFEEIAEIVENVDIDPSNVVLMNQGRTKGEIISKEHWLVNRCIELGYRYSDRLHVRLWGSKRGV